MQIFNSVRLQSHHPVETAYYAIGDAHGHADALKKLLKNIKKDIRIRQNLNPNFNAEIVFMGDYVDRGPDSSKILDLLIEEHKEEKADGIKRVFIKGNHEFLLDVFLNEKHPSQIYLNGQNLLNNGGLCTLAEYGIFFHDKARIEGDSNFQFTVRDTNPPLILDLGDLMTARDQLQERMPKEQREFLENLRYAYDTPDFYFCHAGTDNNKPIQDQSPQFVMGISEQRLVREFARSSGHPEKIVVTGHTIVREAHLVTNEQGGGRVSTDTGAFENGKLSCAILEKRQLSGTLTARTHNAPFYQNFVPTPECRYPKKTPTKMSQPLDVVEQQV
ncbi:MAG: metallophosphoesterase [Alphaproteobacteria bacterium]|nr:metallophosphoesterase [Alphaproteobacteria bacterium]